MAMEPHIAVIVKCNTPTVATVTAIATAATDAIGVSVADLHPPLRASLVLVERTSKVGGVSVEYPLHDMLERVSWFGLAPQPKRAAD